MESSVLRPTCHNYMTHCNPINPIETLGSFHDAGFWHLVCWTRATPPEPECEANWALSSCSGLGYSQLSYHRFRVQVVKAWVSNLSTAYLGIVIRLKVQSPRSLSLHRIVLVISCGTWQQASEPPEQRLAFPCRHFRSTSPTIDESSLSGASFGSVGEFEAHASVFRNGGWSVLDLSIWVVRADPLVETRQTAPCRPIRGNSISVSSTLPPSWYSVLGSELRSGGYIIILRIPTLDLHHFVPCLFHYMFSWFHVCIHSSLLCLNNSCERAQVWRVDRVEGLFLGRFHLWETIIIIIIISIIINTIDNNTNYSYYHIIITIIIIIIFMIIVSVIPTLD